MSLTQDETRRQVPSKKISRRQCVKYAGAGIAAAAVAGLGYYMSKPMLSRTSAQTETSGTQTLVLSSSPYAPTVKLDTQHLTGTRYGVIHQTHMAYISTHT